MSRESNLEKRFVKKVQELGGWAIKMNPVGLRGIPDRLVLLPEGVLVWVELKTDTGRPSKIQLAVHRKLERLGQTVDIVQGRRGVDEWVEKHTKETQYGRN